MNAQTLSKLDIVTAQAARLGVKDRALLVQTILRKLSLDFPDTDLDCAAEHVGEFVAECQAEDDLQDGLNSHANRASICAENTADIAREAEVV